MAIEQQLKQSAAMAEAQHALLDNALAAAGKPPVAKATITDLIREAQEGPPALKPGDLDYVRSRIKRMAAFLADDRKSQVVVDSALIIMLDRHLNERG